jgi:hypothetical protein
MTTARRKARRIMKVSITLAAIAIVIGYGFLKARLFLEGPQVIVEAPIDGMVVNDSIITINGTAKNIAHLSLDGGKIFTDEAGVFSETRLLSYGYNTVTVSASDKFGRNTEKTLRIMYK